MLSNFVIYKKKSLELVNAPLKAARKLRNIVLVKLTSSFVVLLGIDLEVCGSTPTVSQTQLAARYQTGRLKSLYNVALKSFIFTRCEVC